MHVALMFLFSIASLIGNSSLRDVFLKENSQQQEETWECSCEDCCCNCDCYDCQPPDEEQKERGNTFKDFFFRKDQDQDDDGDAEHDHPKTNSLKEFFFKKKATDEDEDDECNPYES